VARTPSADGRTRTAGVGRATLLVATAIAAAIIVLVSGALRSGPNPSASASPGVTADGGSLDLGTLPPVSSAVPSEPSTPAPPEPTAIPDLRGEFVGALGLVETCPVLFLRDGVFELILPDRYGSRIRDGRVQILSTNRFVIASEGDLLGINGTVREGGSVCMAGPQLHVSRIVEVLSRDGE
jgi:hypothetical protein